MYRRRTGDGRYSPARSIAAISSSQALTPAFSIVSMLSPSTPAAPPLLRTRFHASSRTSRLEIRSYSAWNRRVRLCLAAT
jgi:hypothetical protein